MQSIVTNHPPVHQTVRNYINTLHAAYPFLEELPSGRSVLGREIFCLTMGKAKDKVLYVAGTHGSEWLTCMVLLRFLDRLCAAYQDGDTIAGVDVRTALLGRGLAFVPCLNPDGVEIALRGYDGALRNSSLVRKLSGGDTRCWQANARGVDLNHNFDAGWKELRKLEREQGIFGPASRQFGGSCPESEDVYKRQGEICSLFASRFKRSSMPYPSKASYCSSTSPYRLSASKEPSAKSASICASHRAKGATASRATCKAGRPGSSTAKGK